MGARLSGGRGFSIGDWNREDVQHLLAIVCPSRRLLLCSSATELDIWITGLQSFAVHHLHLAIIIRPFENDGYVSMTFILPRFGKQKKNEEQHKAKTWISGQL
ncbi:hypothetical protein Y1Q_0011613 [Alligator mississippiensis]|uniref:Uncharacterized protein n=1 Tax=Alligator mississippiensis TaxID=8496 RepID=A0A151M0J2_ALLMI|nr:hypothetical protein Y1Q_0011613 [Alligator mississippiensis]